MSDADWLEAIDVSRRRKAKSSLIAFTEYTFPRYLAASHHLLIASKLEAVERGEIDRLIIEMPPRHGKSELVSRRFPVWYLSRHPMREVIVASYSTDLARTFGSAARNTATGVELADIMKLDENDYVAKLIERDKEESPEKLLRDIEGISTSDRFRRLIGDGFGFELSPDTSSKEEWKTTAGGGYVSAGVGKGITGRGGNLIIIDDPVKDRKEAESETIREAVKDWYTSTLYTRLEKPGAIIVCATRWHEDDLTGWLRQADADGIGDNWHVVSLPALTKSAEGVFRALWPEKFDVDELLRIKAALSLKSPRDWQALYQQSPAPDEGAYFKREDFRYFDRLPDNVRIFAASDLAAGSEEGDYTVHVVVALDTEDNIYVLDVYRTREDAAEWIDAMATHVEHFKPMRWGQEKGPIWRTIESTVRSALRDAKLYVDIRDYPTTSDKPTRALAFQARIRVRKVFFRRGASWLDWLEPEMLVFPNGTHDDGVDALGIIGQMAAEIGAPAPTTPARAPRKKRYQRGPLRQKRERWAG